jgi:hypothetical protein
MRPIIVTASEMPLGNSTTHDGTRTSGNLVK